MKKKRLMITLLLLITVFMFIGFAYAYLAGGISNANKQTASITTGTMNLVFADGTTSFQAKSITIGESVTKTFTIENTGTLDTIASLYFKDLKNTYMERSLIYTLEYSTSENGTYTVLRKDATMPRSDAGAKELIYGRITVPAGEKQYYKLTVSFIDTGIDQTADLSATFNTSFTLEAGHDTTSESDKTLAALGLTEYLNEGVPTNFASGSSSDEGIFAAEDNYGTSYYFRGDVQNNTLKFGITTKSILEYCYTGAATTKCYNTFSECRSQHGTECESTRNPHVTDIVWRIIRINGDGTLRIIAVDEGITNGKFDENVPTSYGYWSLETGYHNTDLEKWYNTNLHDNYDEYISYDTMFCFDANYYKKENVTYDFEYTPDYSSPFLNYTFEGYSHSYDAQLRETNPSLYCNLPKDDMNSGQTRLTGNDGLNAPVATITMDEAIMAGVYVLNDPESAGAIATTYLYDISGRSSFGGLATMTPYESNMLSRNSGFGDVVTNGVYQILGYQGDFQGETWRVGEYWAETNPVINLKADYAREFVWDATQNAYVHP